MDIDKLLESNEEFINETSICESNDIRDAVSKKDEEIYNILKIEIERIMEDTNLSDLDKDDEFNTWFSATRFFSQKFKLIDDKLKTMDEEIAKEPDKQDEIEEFYTKQINQFLQEIDEKLAVLQEEIY